MTALVTYWRHPPLAGVAGRCIGREDVTVDPRKARRLARRIHADARRRGLPRRVVTSPLRRCADVGRALDALGWHHRIDAALIEADFGRWTGRSWDGIGAAAVDAWCADFGHHAPGGGESLAGLSARVGAWQPLDGESVVVTHGGWIAMRRWRAAHGEALPTADRWPPPPACGTAWTEDGAASTAASGSTAISWSGGKDSMLALLRLRDAGLAPTHFVTMLDADGTSKSHALPSAVLQAQVECLGGRWMGVRVPDAPGAYAAAFDAALADCIRRGVRRMAFGDIDLQAHRDWLQARCTAVGLEAVFPLWGEARVELAREVIDRGIRARLVVVDTAHLDARFCGRDYDPSLLAELPPGCCPCGEDGEFHTLVVDGPGFRRPLAVRTGAVRRQAAPPGFRPTELAVLAVDLDAPAPAGDVSSP